MSRLNIGAGNNPIPGWVNIDKYYYPGSTHPQLDKGLVDRWEQNEESQWLYGDATTLEQFKDDTFDEVMMIHCLEHLDMEQGNMAILHAYRVLKPGGKFEVEVPDLTKGCRLLPETPFNEEGDNSRWHRVMGIIYGAVGQEQGGEGQYHLCGYTQPYLKFKLKERGFKDIENLPVGFGHGNDTEHGHGEPEFDMRFRCYK